MNRLKNASAVFSLVWKVSPSYFFLLILNSLAYSGQILANVVLPKYLIDELMGGKNPTALITVVAAIAGANLLFTALKKTAKRFLAVKEWDVTYQIEREFANKIMSVEYRNLEDPHYLDLKERASFAIRNHGAVSNLVNNTVTFCNQLVTIASMLAIMLRLTWILVAVLLVTVAALIAIQAMFSSYQQKVFAEIIPINRRYGYYVNLAFDKINHKDARIYGMGPMIGDTVTRYNRDIVAWFSKMHRRMGISFALFQVIVVLQTTFAYGYVGAQTIGGGLGIGDLTMYVSAAISFSAAVISMGVAIVTIFQMLGYLEPLSELMAVPDSADVGGRENLETVRSIKFEHVDFSYPKTDKKVLDDISFEIKQGEKISIVGLNGAGKSTIVKLICRLYHPDGGKILINGRDIFDYELSDYLAELAAVFQDFKLFNFTIRENITCRPPEADDERVEKLLDEVGMSDKIASLAYGDLTLFGKEFDEEGVDFSGGQGQKIAIARALYKHSSLVILDEPTSALDPIAESEIYENFNELVGDKTTIYISHRMSSSVFCDRILVINGGKVEAFDTHRNLMKDKEGLYYKLFTSQAEHYKL